MDVKCHAMYVHVSGFRYGLDTLQERFQFHMRIPPCTVRACRGTLRLSARETGRVCGTLKRGLRVMKAVPEHRGLEEAGGALRFLY